MGYRATFVTDDAPLAIPSWFVEEWEHCVFFGDQDGQPSFPIASKLAQKTWVPMLTDLWQVTVDAGDDSEVMVAFVWEGGRVESTTVSADKPPVAMA